MSASRDQYSPFEHSLLFEESGGICPKCDISLSIKKKGSSKPYKKYELAHIYPLNATSNQKLALLHVQVPSNLNALSNLIALCPSCHTVYDKDFKIEEYNEILAIKAEQAHATTIKNSFEKHNIAVEIFKVIDAIANELHDYVNDSEIKYDPKTIENKIGNGMRAVKKRAIKQNVTDYFYQIRGYLHQLEIANQHIVVKKIQSQIHTFYLEMCQISPNSKEKIFDGIVSWLHSKSKISNDACIVLTAFFVQNCEVFDAGTK